jgi:endonuclease YncB( thermonuclease family)
MEAATYDNVTPFVPEIRMGKVVKVYDGDTITIAARIIVDGKEIPRLYRFSVRLNGIDTPELKTKNTVEKTRAILARDDLSDYILGNIVILSNVSYDKYGRTLADVFTQSGVNISEWMINRGHAVRYDGGTKHQPDDWYK